MTLDDDAPSDLAKDLSSQMNSQGGASPQVIESLRAAIAQYQRVLQVNANDVPALLGMAEALASVNRLDDAIAFAARAAAAEPANEVAALVHSTMLRRAGRNSEAAEAADRALIIEPDNLRALNAATIALLRDNQLDEAAKRNERALRLMPSNIEARLHHADLLRRRGDLGSARQSLEDQLKSAFSLESRANVFHSLGRVLDALGEFDAAFDAFTKCNDARLMTSNARRFDADYIFRTLHRYRTSTAGHAARRFSPGQFVPLPQRVAFLVGFPRSGTTLIEQMLGAHPDIGITDERPMLQMTILSLTGQREQASLPELLEQQSANGLNRLRAHYAAFVRRFRPDAASKPALVDKYPLNLMELGFLNVVFPDAPVIVMIRDPRDACLSCFMQRFALNPAMVNFLDWSRTCRLYYRLMDLYVHLRTRVANPIVEVHYRDLVQSPEPALRRILEVMNMQWDERVLAYHRPDMTRAVATPSAQAVHSPLYTTAINRWKHYARHFESVASELAPAIKEFGYDSA
jgi:tetratricopeptide (TPR) repeat protein